MPDGDERDARLDDGTEEIGRSLRRDGAGPRSSWTILLWDGGLFTVDAGRRGGLEVRGWEAPAAYLEATREEGVWRIVRTIAGRDLAGGLVLTVLLASELARLADDDPHASSGDR